MKTEKHSLKAEESSTTFEFISEGPMGAIRKLIQFQETNEPSLYNLAFGDKVGEAEIDDLAISNNGDSEKVLATVVAALYAFFDKHPTAPRWRPLCTRLEVRPLEQGFTAWELQNTMMR